MVSSGFPSECAPSSNIFTFSTMPMEEKSAWMEPMPRGCSIPKVLTPNSWITSDTLL